MGLGGVAGRVTWLDLEGVTGELRGSGKSGDGADGKGVTSSQGGIGSAMGFFCCVSTFFLLLASFFARRNAFSVLGGTAGGLAAVFTICLIS